jgi:hypothetical protein
MVAACLAGCRPTAPFQAESGAVAGRLAALALLPEETQIVLSIDLARLRGQPVWKSSSSALAKHAQPWLDAITAGTGIEPVAQVHRIFIGLPAERQADGRFLLLAETDNLNPARVEAWLKTRSRGPMSVWFPGPRQVVIGKGAWAMGTLPRRPHSAADNPELRRLCERAAGEHGIWLAALVPMAVRTSLWGRDSTADVASLTRILGFLDDARGLHVELVGEFANTADPPLLAHRLQVLHNQAKRDPHLLVAGLSPYLAALRVEARDASVRAALDLPDPQADDVILRIEALALEARTKYSLAP